MLSHLEWRVDRCCIDQFYRLVHPEPESDGAEVEILELRVGLVAATANAQVGVLADALHLDVLENVWGRGRGLLGGGWVDC